jgi:sirohydrochlorin cobaltochelatase
LSRSITLALAAWLAAGETRIGELMISGQYELRHHLDATLDGLTLHTVPEAARDIALYDAAGEYRPLRTAPTLKRGWRLAFGTIGQLHEALDGFYPAMLAARFAFQQGRLGVTPLRETLGRQSGMYAVTRKITDSQAGALIGDFCRTDGGCLKTILWPIAPGLPVTSLPPEKFDPSATGSGIPLLCAEACNLLVAKARETVKQAPSAP